MSHLPMISERTARSEYLIDPYSKAFGDRVVFLGTALDDQTANDVLVQLLYLDADNPGRDIGVYLNSPGGSLTAMLAVYDTIRSLASDVQTVCVGQCGPEAAMLLAAGAKGKRMMLPNARVILHQPSLDVRQGATQDLQIEAQELLRQRTALETILAEHTGRTVEQIRADLSRPKVLDGPAAIEFGLVDVVLADRATLRTAG
ncbi:MAG: ATP-dependent Clp protease proteolytic subunit [Hamadaea sp.]|uniref:ClpP family protease n=1 Tax=Hamadaea sp. TaxID=2024425 RepID=UPI00185170B8|nr:ATP-dependent Clp protease proteolytic subunit [Hamadaea sp.]NUR73313.1 ATP-dependent Clp protease proteolytic subunit [Hamadaea sp.]NUT21508.1 ATP-dependent Clp protease proteolytic subunit [Hamadaea sp.]